MAVTTPWAQPEPNESENYEPKPTLGNATVAGLQSAGAGVFVATIQNALGTHGHGAAGVFTRYGSTIGLFGEWAGIINTLDDAQCIVYSCYGCNIRGNRSHCCQHSGDRGFSERCGGCLCCWLPCGYPWYVDGPFGLVHSSHHHPCFIQLALYQWPWVLAPYSQPPSAPSTMLGRALQEMCRTSPQRSEGNGSSSRSLSLHQGQPSENDIDML
jgi:hypothetical protein